MLYLDFRRTLSDLTARYASELRAALDNAPLKDHKRIRIEFADRKRCEVAAVHEAYNGAQRAAKAARQAAERSPLSKAAEGYRAVFEGMLPNTFWTAPLNADESDVRCAMVAAGVVGMYMCRDHRGLVVTRPAEKPTDLGDK